MASPIKIQVLETYREIPIVELQYLEPTLLDAELHVEQAKALLELPYPRFAVIISYQNLSYMSTYGPQEQAAIYQTPAFQELLGRAVTLIRYHAGSLTCMIQTMSAHTLLRAGASNFAPDRPSAVRAARRAVDQHNEKALSAQTAG
jgi:hypothetical protein